MNVNNYGIKMYFVKFKKVNRRLVFNHCFCTITNFTSHNFPRNLNNNVIKYLYLIPYKTHIKSKN